VGARAAVQRQPFAHRLRRAISQPCRLAHILLRALVKQAEEKIEMNTRQSAFSACGMSVGISSALALALGACSPDDPALGLDRTDPQQNPGSPANGGILSPTSSMRSFRSLNAKSAAKIRKRAAEKAIAEQAARQISAAQLKAVSPQLQLGEDDVLRPISSEHGENGDVSVRCAHYHKGLRVIGSNAIIHLDAQSNINRVTNAISSHIRIPLSPTLDSQGAAAAVMADPERLPYHEEPDVKLAILPLRERVLKTTGRPPRPNHSNLNADYLERQLLRYQLVYVVDTEEEDRLGSPRYRSMHYVVDAHTGKILQERSLGHQLTPDSNPGESMYAYPNGYFTYDQSVTLDTAFGREFVWEDDYNIMEDMYREFYVEDDEFGTWEGSNYSENNETWGDGLSWPGGYTSDNQHRQTSIVDAKYALEAVWDMFDNVYDRQGVDDDYYSVNCFVHVESVGDDAEYWQTWGNVNVGDGTWRTSLDTLGHEYGHAFDDFTANLLDGADGETKGLKEGIADISGVMLTYYVYNRGLYAGADFIPGGSGPPTSVNTGTPGLGTIDFWVGIGSGRSLRTPNRPYWWSGIGSEDKYLALGPLVHAFYFLAMGSSWNTTAAPYTTFSYVIPSGMDGIGIDTAARIWYRAMTAEFNEDTTYDDADNAMIAAAESLFGTGGDPEAAEVTAVRYATAAANFGSRPDDYPMPQSVPESEPNDSQTSQFQFLSKPLDASPLNERPTRLEVVGAATNGQIDWYQARVPNGYGLKITLIPTWGQDQDLQVFDVGTSNSLGASAQDDNACLPEVVRIPYTLNPAGPYTAFDIKIAGASPTTHGGYRLYLDWIQYCSTTTAPAEVFSNQVVGCAGQEEVAEKDSLCSPNAHVCTAQEWLSLAGGGSPTSPTHNYWLGDINLRYTGSSGTCSAAPSGTLCGSSGGMRVCGTSQPDAEGNDCSTKTNCGYLTNSTSHFLGCGETDMTAGALCCSNS
jgi:Zn-dependent metalloprotease